MLSESLTACDGKRCIYTVQCDISSCLGSELQSYMRHAQVFAECTSVQDSVGMANSGISSDIAKFMHRKQGVYG